MKHLKITLVTFFSIFILKNGNAQSGNTNIQDIKGNSLNSVTTAVPFLRINTDARSGAMGDCGIATTPDADGDFHNPAKLAMIQYNYGGNIAYTPWLQRLATDIHLFKVGGYYKLKGKQTLATSFRYFSLGKITFNDDQGNNPFIFNPSELAWEVHYARALNKNLSLGVSMRYIYSNLAKGQPIQGGSGTAKAGNAGAGDISLFYTKPINLKKMKSNFNLGMNISNIGSKMAYTSSVSGDFLPANLGIGLGYELQIDEHNQVNFYTDINKLMSPTAKSKYIDSVDANGKIISSGKVINPDYDKNNNGTADFREGSSIKGIFTSWGDAPGYTYKQGNEIKHKGKAKEELSEFLVSFGAEYWYNKLFALRAGYFFEPPTKGGRSYLTAGLGLKYSVFNLNFSYLAPTNTKRGPLDNTLRFSMLFNFGEKGKTKVAKDQTLPE